MKVRVKWTKTGVLKFIGHLDVQRYFQKALMRAELPVSFSKGMSPHQIMSFAAPLGLGMTSEGEYADISFDWTYSSEEMLSRINAVMNEGISVLEFKEIDEKEKNCMAVTAAADYLVTFREGYYYKDAFLKRTQPFSMQEKIPIVKKTKRSEKEVDIAPMILDIREYESEPLLPGLPLKQEGIFMKLVTGSAENLKPQLVMEAFCKYLGYDYDPMGFQYHRLETYLKKDGELQPLGSVGWEITEEKHPEDVYKRQTVFFLDKEGQQLCRPISWMDRSWQSNEKYSDKWKDNLDAWQYFLVNYSRMNWMQREYPDIFEKVEKYFTTSGYIHYKLTGEFADSLGNNQMCIRDSDSKNDRILLLWQQ